MPDGEDTRCKVCTQSGRICAVTHTGTPLLLSRHVVRGRGEMGGDCRGGEWRAGGVVWRRYRCGRRGSRGGGSPAWPGDGWSSLYRLVEDVHRWRLRNAVLTLGEASQVRATAIAPNASQGATSLSYRVAIQGKCLMRQKSGRPGCTLSPLCRFAGQSRGALFGCGRRNRTAARLRQPSLGHQVGPERDRKG
jgi:hypothetical protein